jgi:dTDP-4-amino-4,6-dideoxygalactose transaminase
MVDKYTWVDLGSSYLPGEITAAFLWAQLEDAEAITARRQRIWADYDDAMIDLEASGAVRRPIIPPDRSNNAHMYQLLLPDLARRTAFIERLRSREIQSVFHYIPLHSSPFGREVGRFVGDMSNTDDASDRLVRLPMWLGLEAQLPMVISEVIAAAAGT